MMMPDRLSLSVRMLSAMLSAGSLLAISGCKLREDSVTVQSGGPSPTATSTSDAWPTPHVVGDRLADPISFDDGGFVLKPPGDVDPVTGKDAAVSAFTKTGLYSSELAGKTPQTFLASMTSYDTSDSLGPDGRILPDHKNRLVWIVYFHNIPSMPVGPARQDGRQVPSQPVDEDILGVTDATTGVLNFVETTTADRQVKNLDRGPLPDRGGKRS